MFWKNDDCELSIPPKQVCEVSFAGLLQQILADEASGMINPVSTEMRYILKSIIMTIQQDFSRPIEIYEPGRFPNRQTFLANLPQTHEELYQYLEELFGGRRRISTGNTSIGFPYSDHPEEGAYNTLFRVLTMREYRKTAAEIVNSDYATQLIIECDNSVYPDHKFWDKTEKDFTDIAVIERDRKHPDGTGKNSATWIVFGPKLGDEDIEKARSEIDSFVEGLRKEFEVWEQT